MEIFGRELSDLKKFLIIVIIFISLIFGFLFVNFVYNLGGSYPSIEPQAELEYSQFKVSNAGLNGTGVYMVKIEVQDLNRGWNNDGTPSDYLVVSKDGDREDTGYATEISTKLEEQELVPNYLSQAESIEESGNGAILADVGDVAYVTNLENGDEIQVFGGVGGYEAWVESYEVKG